MGRRLVQELLGLAKLEDTPLVRRLLLLGLRSLHHFLAYGGTVSTALVDSIISGLDGMLGDQVNAIMHHPGFQSMERSWRGLKFLIDHADFEENIEIVLLSVSKGDLLNDFEDTPERVRSGLYAHVYTSGYGQFGGHPVGAIIADYTFGPGPQDIRLLHFVSGVAAMAHAPFLASVDKEMFGVDDWDTLPNLKDLKTVFEMPQYARWRAFRETPDARYVGLTLPRFLLRLPWGMSVNPTKRFVFEEDLSSTEHFCWGNTVFALATRLTDSFSQYRWCANIIGPDGGGTVEELPIYQYESLGQIHVKMPTDVLISEHREYELAEEGFIALTVRKGADNAAFFSANSCQKAKKYPSTTEGKQLELSYRLAVQLPYMMIMNRLAHYIKVIQRENIGNWKASKDLERELNQWISQYVTEMDDPDPVTRSKRPMRMAQVVVSEVPGDPGWYAVKILARPHFKYMGATFTMALAGKLDKQ